MSKLSKLSILAALAVSVGIIFVVHNSQENDRIRLHQGVIMDQERQARKLKQFEDLKEST